MSLKNLLIAASLCALVAHASQAGTILTVAPLGLNGSNNREWAVNIAQDVVPGSLAAELAFAIDGANLLDVVVGNAAIWDTPLPANNPFTGTPTEGIYIDLDQRSVVFRIRQCNCHFDRTDSVPEDHDGRRGINDNSLRHCCIRKRDLGCTHCPGRNDFQWLHWLSHGRPRAGIGDDSSGRYYYMRHCLAHGGGRESATMLFAPAQPHVFSI